MMLTSRWTDALVLKRAALQLAPFLPACQRVKGWGDIQGFYEYIRKEVDMEMFGRADGFLLSVTGISRGA